jgi:hypothetical protein
MATFYKNHNFAITYMYVDKIAGKEITDILNTSKFDK